MSHRMVNLVRSSSLGARLTVHARFVAWVLADCASVDGDGIYPSLHHLMRVTGISRSSLWRALRSLTSSGWLVDDGIQNGTRHWHICVAWIDAADTNAEHRTPVRTYVPWQRGATRGAPDRSAVQRAWHVPNRDAR